MKNEKEELIVSAIARLLSILFIGIVLQNLWNSFSERTISYWQAVGLLYCGVVLLNMAKNILRNESKK